MTELEELKLAYAECSRQRNELLNKLKSQAQRPWVGLTDEDLKPLSDKWRIVYGGWVGDFAKEIEAKLKERNS